MQGHEEFSKVSLPLLIECLNWLSCVRTWNNLIGKHKFCFTVVWDLALEGQPPGVPQESKIWILPWFPNNLGIEGNGFLLNLTVCKLSQTATFLVRSVGHVDTFLHYYGDWRNNSSWTHSFQHKVSRTKRSCLCTKHLLLRKKKLNIILLWMRAHRPIRW